MNSFQRTIALRASVVVVAAALLSVAGCGGLRFKPLPRKYPVGTPWRGVALLHLDHQDGARGYGTEAALLSLQNARRAGVNSVSLRVPGRQPSIRDPQIRFGEEPPHGETDGRVRTMIRQARALGMMVMLKPHIMLDEITDKEWRGRIDFEDPAHLDLWWENYTTFILHYASFAESENVECFCIGVELLDMVRRSPGRWLALIAQTREVFTGSLTYAANWDEEFEEVPFWPALDLIGVQCFFPLTDSEVPRDRELRAGVRRVSDDLHRVATRSERKLLLTEVGFKSTRGATVKPWVWPSDDTIVDLDLQLRAYRVILDEFEGKEWFRGLFWWNWLTEPYPGSKADRIFTPQGKPAEELLRRRWGGGS